MRRVLNMAKHLIKFNKDYVSSPLSFWVHIDEPHNGRWIWDSAQKHHPELPKPVFSKGYPMLVVDALGHELRFSSIEEIEHFLEVITQKNMPSSSKLASQRRMSTGLNSHWLSRLPAKFKSWNNRQKYIPHIQDGLDAFKECYKS